MNARHAIWLWGWAVLAGTCAPAQVTVVHRPDTSRKNDFYVSNRQPLAPNPLVRLPIRAIEPRGWLRKQLELEAQGFTGHLGEISDFLQKENNAWLDPRGGQHGWEEVPYWLKGYVNLAYVLRDEAMIREARVWIEAAINSRQPDGWFGPESNRTRLKGNADLWPNMIMLYCLQDYYDLANDARVIELMRAYFRYLTTIPEEKFLPDYWDTMRAGDLLLSVYWLYNRVGEPWLLELGHKIHRRTAAWEKGVVNWHNVNFAQAFRQPASYWMQSGNPLHARASYRNYDTMRDKYGQVPGGMYGADENAREGYDDPRQAVETCGMVEMMLSTETLTWITGDLLWADRCEDVAFNSLPAALTADMKALRYLTAPNQAVSDARNKSPGVQNRGPMMHMNPHLHRCCQHNWGHGWPYYAEHLYFATPDNGLAAVFYSESQVVFKAGEGTEVTVGQRTRYPFGEEVELIVRTPRPVTFPLYLRLPGWCDAPRLEINGQPATIPADRGPGRYVKAARRWSNGDRVLLTLPMKIALRRWARNHHSASVDRGPLTYSLKIGEKYVRAGGSEKWPGWEIYPTTPWNYGLVLDNKDPAASMELVRRDWPASDMPFTHEGVPLEIKATGKRIPEWQLDQHGLVAELQDSPVKSYEPAEPITLIPMGAARLRISAFPVIGEGPSARAWKKPAGPATP